MFLRWWKQSCFALTYLEKFCYKKFYAKITSSRGGSGSNLKFAASTSLFKIYSQISKLKYTLKTGANVGIK